MENGQNLAVVTPGDSAGSKPLRRTRYGDRERFVQELLRGQSLKAAYGAAGYVGHPLFANMNNVELPRISGPNRCRSRRRNPARRACAPHQNGTMVPIWCATR